MSIERISDQSDSNLDSSGPSFIKAPALSKSKNQSFKEASKFTYWTYVKSWKIECMKNRNDVTWQEISKISNMNWFIFVFAQVKSTNGGENDVGDSFWRFLMDADSMRLSKQQ